MTDFRAALFDLSQSVVGRTLEARTAGAIGAVINIGAKNLLAEPWRVARIIRGAHDMSVEELRAQTARRRRAVRPIDLNQAIALAQLGAALQSPHFAAVWTNWRSGAPSQSPGDALCE